MKSIRILFLVAVCFIGINLQMCCDCGEVKEYFDIQDMSLSYVLADTTAWFEEDTMISYDKLSHFNVEFQVEYISSVLTPTFCDFNTMGQAYGCDCPSVGNKGSKEEVIESFEIRTIYDFNEEFSANDVINEMFEISPRWWEDHFVDVNMHFENDSSRVREEYFKIRPKMRPTTDSLFRIEVIMDLSTGERYSSVSPFIRFQD